MQLIHQNPSRCMRGYVQINTLAVEQYYQDKWNIINTDAKLHKIFPNQAIIAYKRDRNLTNHLIRAKAKGKPNPSTTLTYLGEKPILNIVPKTNKCNKPGCLCCLALQPSSAVTSPITGQTFPILTTMNCETKNI